MQFLLLNIKGNHGNKTILFEKFHKMHQRLVLKTLSLETAIGQWRATCDMQRFVEKQTRLFDDLQG